VSFATRGRGARLITDAADDDVPEREEPERTASLVAR
jgi:hypothetical protein